ncbi:hypothetical protein BGX28_003548 [Mortierella sp. GBA30]|nr:hypothetical protein BGX28_003548 [Mortierella sp. GBA30]
MAGPMVKDGLKELDCLKQLLIAAGKENACVNVGNFYSRLYGLCNIVTIDFVVCAEGISCVEIRDWGTGKVLGKIPKLVLMLAVSGVIKTGHPVLGVTLAHDTVNHAEVWMFDLPAGPSSESEAAGVAVRG